MHRREQIFQIFQLRLYSFDEAHFDHSLQAFQRLVVNRNADLCRFALRAQNQVPIGTGQFQVFVFVSKRIKELEIGFRRDRRIFLNCLTFLRG